MRATLFYVVPSFRCHCPAKTFRKARQAVQYPQQVADTFKVAYSVWRVHKSAFVSWNPRPPIWDSMARTA
jgi:hypothetical protein